MAKVAVVPCPVPLLFSRPVLSKLGAQYDLAAQKVTLRALNLFDLEVQDSGTGHPALLVSQFPEGPPPMSEDLQCDDVWAPVGVYMAASASSGSCPHSPLFYTKKVPLEVHNMLADGSVLKAPSFYSWWKNANQSNDFWIETDHEMIRIHVTPRKALFDPSLWKTNQASLRYALLAKLRGGRVSELIPALSEGIEVRSLADSLHEQLPCPNVGLWIGRSRFVKHGNFKPAVGPSIGSPESPLDACSRSPFSMEDEEGRTVARVDGAGSPSTHQLDSARAANSSDGDSQQPRTPIQEGGRRDEGTHQVQLAGVDEDGHRTRNPTTSQANPRMAIAEPASVEVDAGRDDRSLRQVQGVALPGDSGGLLGVGDQGVQGQPKPSPGSGKVGNMGGDRTQATRVQGAAHEELGGRPRGHGEDSSTFTGGSPWSKLGFILEPGKRLYSKAEGFLSTSSGPGGRGVHCRGGRDCNAEDSPGSARGKEGVEGRRDHHRSEGRTSVLNGDAGDVAACISGSDAGSAQSRKKGDRVNDSGDDAAYSGVPGAGTARSTVVEIGSEVEYELCGSETESEVDIDPRKKAVAGIRRLKRMNRSTATKIKDQVKVLGTVLMACSLAIASVAAEAVVEPVADVFAVFTSSKELMNQDRREVDCLELFAGKGRISEAFAKKGRGVLCPRDVKYGHDFRSPSSRQEVLDDVQKHRPGLVWMAPPCTLWGNFSRMNYSRQELRRLRRKEMVLLDFCDEVMKLQTSLGGQFALENPRGSDMWRAPKLQEWITGGGAHLSKVDLCSYNMRSIDEQFRLLKPITLLCSNEVFADQISRQCTKDHEHMPIQGQNTAHSGAYTTAFSNAVVRAYDKSEKCERVYPTQTLPNRERSRARSRTPVQEQAEVETPEPYGAAAITFKGKVNPVIAATLKRVHQNLGHPPNRELVRHLKIGGASSAVLQTAEQLICRTCEKSSKARPHKISNPVVALDFNEVVAADIIWIDTADARNKPALNVVDLASTYQVVIPLPGIKSEDVSQAFASGWIQWAGVPKQLLVDLDSAFKDRFLTLMDEKCIILRAAAGQAHWQNGVCERHGGAWKAVWAKFVEETLVLEEEIFEACAAVSDAKNQLRNKSGFSPRQWVFGSNGRQVGDLFDGTEDVAAIPLETADSRFARSQVLRMGARAAFLQCQTREALDRAVNHKPRVAAKPFEVGDLAYIYREYRQGKGKKPSATWTGPAVVIGKEGSNYWLARGGRCLLAAPEHLRPADHEEVSEALRVKMAMKEVRQMMTSLQAEEYEDVDDTDAPGFPAAAPSPPVPGADMEVETLLEGGQPSSLPPPWAEAASREQQIRSAARRAHVLDDVPHDFKKPRAQFMVKRCVSEKGKEKQLEKELPWGLIPPEERELYRQAELKQWNEHVDFGAVRALSLAESDQVRKTVSSDRILRSRFAYKDKNYAKRKCDPSVPPKPKARLCIAGHMDPDLGNKDMAVDAPTAGRHSILLALQVALCRSWKVSTGDIKAAFLNGVPAPRKLYFSQPRGGMPTLEQGQIIEVVKGVFGLSTSPKLWWMKLSKEILDIKIAVQEDKLHVIQNPVDPCVFQFLDQGDQRVRGLLLTHVDDIMLLTEEKLSGPIQEALQQRFPVDEWLADEFEYVGCEYKCAPGYVNISQKNYTDGRVDKVTAKCAPDGSVTKEQIEENRTSIGSLSWLAKQTRPDLQFAVSQAQKCQNDPSAEDIKKTNKAVDMAKAHAGQGICLRAIPEDEVAFITFHDAAWGNVDPDVQEPEDPSWYGGHQLASQLGSLVLIASKKVFSSGRGTFSLVDWKSKGSQRVCRSTFAGETMACCDGLESALFLRCLFLTFTQGRMVVEAESGQFASVHAVTDCKSLFDHLHREGVPKAPSEKRLAIDWAGLRQIMMREARFQWLETFGGAFEPTPEKPCRPPLHWLPTHLQLADILTKHLNANEWWEMIGRGSFDFPLRRVASPTS